VAATLVADLPEFGRLTENRSQPSSDSPPIRTKAEKRAGRPKPATEDRSCAAPARAAIRHPSPMQDFYNRLVETNHRPGKVALTAVMRKILVIASAVARDPFKATQPQTA
jgi:transposase